MFDLMARPTAASVAVSTYDTAAPLPDYLERHYWWAYLRPGGRAIFIDYARPAPWHPLRPVMAAIFALLEPFAKTLWRRDIKSFATGATDHDWTREAFFGDLYQKTIATRRDGRKSKPTRL